MTFLIGISVGTHTLYKDVLKTAITAYLKINNGLELSPDQLNFWNDQCIPLKLVSVIKFYTLRPKSVSEGTVMTVLPFRVISIRFQQQSSESTSASSYFWLRRWRMLTAWKCSKCGRWHGEVCRPAWVAVEMCLVSGVVYKIHTIPCVVIWKIHHRWFAGTTFEGSLICNF